MRDTLITLSNKLGFLDIYGFLRRKITKSQVAILMYHHVTSQEIFENQILYLSQKYEIISLVQLAQLINEKETLPEKAVVITFDDGNKDNYKYAFPVLKKNKVHATIFLTTGHIDTDNLFWWDQLSYLINNTQKDELNIGEFGKYSLRSKNDKQKVEFILTERLKKVPEQTKQEILNKIIESCEIIIPEGTGFSKILSWDEVKEMSDAGIDFGGHTVNHPILTNVPLERAKNEILVSKKMIEKEIGKQVTTFAYPNGDYNSDMTAFIKECGFLCAVSVLPGNLVKLRDNIYALPRVNAHEDISKLKVVLSGLWGDSPLSLK
jgi:peptidoglycan/xylan/chitin deacetylase (PgdA/CDA1 family)